MDEWAEVYNECKLLCNIRVTQGMAMHIFAFCGVFWCIKLDGQSYK